MRGQGGLNNRKYFDTVTIQKNYGAGGIGKGSWVGRQQAEGSKFGFVASEMHLNCLLTFRLTMYCLKSETCIWRLEWILHCQQETNPRVHLRDKLTEHSCSASTHSL